jgi:osmotically inducible protein OsmC
MKRTASAAWKGGLKDGKGTLSTQSTALSNLPYSFAMRFEDQPGTNPEELIGAAHAGCYSMALSGVLGGAGITAEEIRTTATVTLDKVDGAFTVTAIHLDVSVTAPGADRNAVAAATETAKVSCPISRLLSAATITMAATIAV